MRGDSPGFLAGLSRRLRRWKLLLLLVAGFGIILAFFNGRNPARSLAEKTRLELRQQGFKLELSEFKLPRNASTNPLLPLPTATPRLVPRGSFSARDYDLMRPITKSSALVVWKEYKFWSDSNEDLWPQIQSELELQRAALDSACAYLCSDAVQLEPVLGPVGELVPQRLNQLRGLVSMLALRTVLDLRKDDPARAFTNLLALTRLVGSWGTEPSELSWMAWFRHLSTAQRATWQALQSTAWTDAQLSELQRLWSRLEFFDRIPETAALERATWLAACKRARESPAPPGPSLREIGSDLINSPDRAWADLTFGLRQSRYRKYGTYKDEVAIMLCFRQRELDFRRAVKTSSWTEMKQLPGVINPAPFKGEPTSPMFPALSRGSPALAGPAVLNPSLLVRAADAEGRRRLTLCALALQRYHLAHADFPVSLVQLMPEFVPSIPLDFMDGEPLRYQRLDTNAFQLYSIGLDCTDDKGTMLARSNALSGYIRFADDSDLVWPRAATDAEVEAARAESERQRSQFVRRYGLAPSASNSPTPTGAIFDLQNGHQ